MALLKNHIVGRLLRLRDPLSGDEHVKRGVLLYVVYGLLVSDHREVVPVALKDLVINAKARANRGAALDYVGHVNALEECKAMDRARERKCE